MSAISCRGWRTSRLLPFPLGKVVCREKNHAQPWQAHYAVPQVEYLLERIVPAGVVYTWTGQGADNEVATAANWDRNAAPGQGDILVFNGITGGFVSPPEGGWDMQGPGLLQKIQVMPSA